MQDRHTDRLPPWVYAVFTLYAAALLVYSQTLSFTFDEGYHLLTAQLILRGKVPYVDFCFPQTPLNAYWNAGWMRLFGESWRVTHIAAALLTIGAVLLSARYVYVRFPVPEWRLAAAIIAGLIAGLNPVLFTYGSVAQPYGMCLFATVASFLAAVSAAGRKGLLLPAAAGLLAGVAAGSSLLTVAALPVLLAWTVFYSRTGNRWTKGLAFCGGTALAFTPIFWLVSKGPRQGLFNLFEYHAFYRRLYWPETTAHDLDVLSAWIDSGPALIAGILAVSGLLYIIRRSTWPAELKAEFYLCAWLAAALCAEISCAHPTFTRYYLLPMPFVAVLAAVGLYSMGSRLAGSAKPLWPALAVAGLLIFGLGKTIYSERDNDDWRISEKLARKVDEVTPRGASLFADETIYFLTRRIPPPGLELAYTHKLVLPPAKQSLMHLLSEAQLKSQLQSGAFSTAYSCDDEDIELYGLADLYTQRAQKNDCEIFWNLKKK